jgi:heme/copper-type cytochrome/quinol oxidase subunit 2
MVGKLDELALGYASAVISAIIMLLLGISGNVGIYTGAVEMMQKWHMFFSLSIAGIIAGMIEAAIIGFVFAYAFGWVYNKFTK